MCFSSSLQAISPLHLINQFPLLCLHNPQVMSPTVAAGTGVSNYNPCMVRKSLALDTYFCEL